MRVHEIPHIIKTRDKEINFSHCDARLMRCECLTYLHYYQEVRVSDFVNNFIFSNKIK